MCVGQVGVGVSTAEVGKRDAVLRGGFRKTELLLEDVDTVGAGNTAEAIEKDLEFGVALQEALDQAKVEDLLEELDVIGNAVNDLDLEVSVGVGANGLEINLGASQYRPRSPNCRGVLLPEFRQSCIP